MTRVRRLPGFFGAAVVFTMVVLACFVVYRLWKEARWSGERLVRAGRLTQIACALQYYHSIHGCLPPAYVTDDSGRRMHSWRVLLRDSFEPGLLPDYDFESPWNSPSNTELRGSELANRYFGPRDARATGRNTTRFVAVVGDHTLWPGQSPRKLGELREEVKERIVVMEIPHSSIEWMEPRDISLSEARRLFLSEHRLHQQGRANHLLYVTLGGKYGTLHCIPDVETFMRMLRVEAANAGGNE